MKRIISLLLVLIMCTSIFTWGNCPSVNASTIPASTDTGIGVLIHDISVDLVTDKETIKELEKYSNTTIPEGVVWFQIAILAYNGFTTPLEFPILHFDFHDQYKVYIFEDYENCSSAYTAKPYDNPEIIDPGSEFVAVAYIGTTSLFDLGPYIHVNNITASAGDDMLMYIYPTISPLFRTDIHHTTTFSAGAYHTVFIHSDETVGAVGQSSKNRCKVEGWRDIISVDASSHTVGLKSDGTVVATGPNGYKQCNVSMWKDIVAIAAGDEHTVGLKSNGTVVAVGNSAKKRLNVSSWRDIVAIDAGNATTYGLKADGSVVATGSNSSGQAKITHWDDIVAISAGDRHVVGMKSDGTVVAAGSNSFGECDVESWTDIVAVAAGNQFTIGLKADGTVVATGLNKEGQCDVSDWADIVAISAGMHHVIGLRADGSYISAGSNGYGQCDLK